ncbi:MAG TPA: hypothetical protein VNH18_06105 [Bryobacteraceae bacterium]|nr:hypothetical protein [Bryobacteraceae bacterium]
MARLVFRALVGLTLVVMFFARRSGGGMGPWEFLPFYYWFLASVFVFGAFGIAAALRAWKEPQNRRALLFDVAIAGIWVPYWFANLK